MTVALQLSLVVVCLNPMMDCFNSPSSKTVAKTSTFPFDENPKHIQRFAFPLMCVVNVSDPSGKRICQICPEKILKQGWGKVFFKASKIYIFWFQICGPRRCIKRDCCGCPGFLPRSIAFTALSFASVRQSVNLFIFLFVCHWWACSRARRNAKMFRPRGRLSQTLRQPLKL